MIGRRVFIIRIKARYNLDLVLWNGNIDGMYELCEYSFTQTRTTHTTPFTTLVNAITINQNWWWYLHTHICVSEWYIQNIGSYRWWIDIFGFQLLPNYECSWDGVRFHWRGYVFFRIYVSGPELLRRRSRRSPFWENISREGQDNIAYWHQCHDNASPDKVRIVPELIEEKV